MPHSTADASQRLAVRRALLAGGLVLATSTAAVALQLLPAPPVAATRSALPDSVIAMPTLPDRAAPAPMPPAPAPGRAWTGTPQLLPVQGWFSDGFRWRRDPLHGRKRFHRGLDIVAPAGAIVRAPADGVVTFAASTGGYGSMIEIRHGSRYATRFAHLDAFLTAAGRIVRLGQPIGLVGSSGRSVGAHLHYEVLKDGRRVNPWPYLGEGRGDPERTTFSLTRTTVLAER